MAEWRAVWTGRWPHLCHGEWELHRDGERVGDPIPFQGLDAGTHGIYERWDFDDDWMEVWEDYADGMDEGEWVDAHRGWLSSIADEADFPAVYRAFRESDFRAGSCGGCI